MSRKDNQICNWSEYKDGKHFRSIDDPSNDMIFVCVWEFHVGGRTSWNTGETVTNSHEWRDLEVGEPDDVAYVYLGFVRKGTIHVSVPEARVWGRTSDWHDLKWEIPYFVGLHQGSGQVKSWRPMHFIAPQQDDWSLFVYSPSESTPDDPWQQRGERYFYYGCDAR
jgi:hypothetical protein